MKKITKQTYKIYWQHARKYKVLVFTILISSIGASLARAIGPLYYKYFIDSIFNATPGKNEIVSELTYIILIIFAIEGVWWLFHRIEALTSNHFQPRVVADLSNTSFEYLHKHSYNFFTNQFVGSLVRKVGRFVDAFERLQERITGDVLQISVRLVIIIVVLSFRHILLGALLLGWMTIYLAINYFFVLKKLKYDVRAAKINSEVTAQLADTITNNNNVKTFTAFTDESKRFQALTSKQFRILRFTLNYGELMIGVQTALMIILQFSLFYYAIRFWNRGLLTIGDFALIQAYIIQVWDRLFSFGRVMQRIYKNLADAEEMTEILNTPHDVNDKLNAKELEITKGKIEFRNVNFTYSKTRAVLKKFDLTIAPGERVGVVGISGAGKTTLTALMLRFYDISDGSINIDGQNISDVTQDSLRRHVGYVPQDPILFHRSLMENIRYGNRGATDDEVYRAAKLAHCDEFIERLPEKYATFVGERGIKLSGGERQRVAIARAILKDAPILILDEATSSLDSQAESVIQDALDNLMRGKTTLVIAHRLSTIMRMDRIIVMHNGVITEEGNHADLIKKQNGIYKKLWDIQAGGFIP